jgi:hypothetical protein
MNIFRSDVEELPDCNDGTPAMADTYDRVEGFLREWRDRHAAGDDPIYDEGVAEFQIRDVARLFYEYQRLSLIERRLIEVLGPQCTSTDGKPVPHSGLLFDK